MCLIFSRPHHRTHIIGQALDDAAHTHNHHALDIIPSFCRFRRRRRRI